MTPDEILELLKNIRRDLSVTQTRLTEAMEAIAKFPTPPTSKHRCPDCGHDHYRSPQQLAEHRYHQHNGAVPEHYLAAERFAGWSDDEKADELRALLPAETPA